MHHQLCGPKDNRKVCDNENKQSCFESGISIDLVRVAVGFIFVLWGPATQFSNKYMEIYFFLRMPSLGLAYF